MAILDLLNEHFYFFKSFDFVFNSYHVGKGNRDISLFDDIAKILKTPPNRILFIDDYPAHIECAKQKGWQTILDIDLESFQLDLAVIMKI